MWILPLVGYAGVLLGFSFLTLAIGRPYFPPLSKPPPLRIATWPVQSYVPANSARTQASGLYYLSELVEEHTVLARKVLTRLIYTIMSIIVLLVLIDRFPFLLSGLSIASHAVYMGNLRHFPIVKLTDPVFILSCLLVLLNHFLWFHHFSTPPTPSSSLTTHASLYDPPATPSFTEIASYFGICVWLVPFALFVSLSAGENVLPSMGSEYATGGSPRTGVERDRRKKKGLVRQAVGRVVEWVGETGEAIGLWREDKARQF